MRLQYAFKFELCTAVADRTHAGHFRIRDQVFKNEHLEQIKNSLDTRDRKQRNSAVPCSDVSVNAQHAQLSDLDTGALRKSSCRHLLGVHVVSRHHSQFIRTRIARLALHVDVRRSDRKRHRAGQLY